MNDNLDFYKWFENIAPKLAHREISFKKIFKYLDGLPTPIIILETGCLRKAENFIGDGQSTLLFDKYTQFRNKNSKVYTVDINPKCTEICKKVVSDKVEITTEDSVKYINNFSKNFLKSNNQLSLLYLDSYDLNYRYPFSSAAHHLKELTASIRILNEKTLVVVDDAPTNMNVIQGTITMSGKKLLFLWLVKKVFL
ncbi:MAG: hypothetical protein CMI70_01305 [Candidatus Pelagibacter sp.]|jgi:hypothetical protein|nr:hypothetical protein [Candidatus Pelagibacter sp.]|tara:strand:+ start:108 stop:695 length:588 start_codon:yes stop_codon:yes gene_type:complete